MEDDEQMSRMTLMSTPDMDDQNLSTLSTVSESAVVAMSGALGGGVDVGGVGVRESLVSTTVSAVGSGTSDTQSQTPEEDNKFVQQLVAAYPSYDTYRQYFKYYSKQVPRFHNLYYENSENRRTRVRFLV